MKTGKWNPLAEALLLTAMVVAIHFTAYRAAWLLFAKSQNYSAGDAVLVVGNSRVEQGILRRRADAAVPGGVAFLASQGMDLKIAARLIESSLSGSKGTREVWLGVDPWQLSAQYSEQGYRNWLPFLGEPGMDGYFREAMRDNEKEYWFLKTIPLLRFNGVKERLLRTAMGLGGVSVNRNVVTLEDIREVTARYAGEPLSVDTLKLRDLESICSSMQDRGVALRLFFMPVIPELSQPWDIPGFRAQVGSLIRKYPSVRFVDFNDRLRDHAYFRDTGHLNLAGAEAFLPVFLDSLARE